MSEASSDERLGQQRMVTILKCCEESQDKVLGMRAGLFPSVVAVEGAEDTVFNLRVWTFLEPRSVRCVVDMVGKWVSVDVVELCEIRSDEAHTNRGHGSLAMPHFLDYVKARGGKQVTGWLSFSDWDHIHRLIHFYRKHGFTVEMEVDPNKSEPPTGSRKVGTIVCLL
jgi:GNAT superfamily N-acetyltransferase